MSLFKKLASRLGISARTPAPRIEPRLRRFSGAQASRLHSGWTTIPTPIDADIRLSLNALVARSRDLSQNAGIFKGFIRLIQNNAVGSDGIALQARAMDFNGKADTLANQAVERAWAKWCKKGVCEITGRHSFRTLLRTAAGTLPRDGEYLIRKRYGVTSRNPFGITLELVDTARLDPLLNVDLGKGRSIRMGIEYDVDGIPAFFHLTTPPGVNGIDYFSHGAKKYERVPAAHIIHGFMIDSPGQSRGVPWVAAGMERIKMLDGYFDAELVAARTAAAKMGFFTENAEGDGYAGDPEDADDPDGPLVMDAEPGVLTQLPHGVTFQGFDPQHPTAAFSDFVKANQRDFATGLGVTYFGLTGDLEAVNYSSGRLGRAEDQELYKEIQNNLIETICENVFPEWISFALTLGQITIAGNRVSVTADKLEKLSSVTWQARRWSMIDPAKEANASSTFIAEGLKSRSQIIRENGGDPDEVFAEIAEENAKLASLGVTLLATIPKGSTQPAQQTDAQGATDETATA